MSGTVIESLMRRAINESTRLKDLMLKVCRKELIKISQIVVSALKNGRRVYIFGNGGSAADAQHIAGELQGRLFLKRKPLPVVALTTNTSSLTAIGNDYGFRYVFERQINGVIDKGDVAIAISTSGMSENVLLAIKTARKSGAITIGFSGKTGGKLAKLVDVCLKIPSKNVARIQECHVLAGHIICEAVERILFGHE
jgi:D-sedoheptulose 7-phosphate isomerase